LNTLPLPLPLSSTSSLPATDYPMQKMPYQLHSLPVEITQLLGIVLESTDLLAVRLVCRDLNRRTMQEFSIRFFTTLQTNLSAKSLQRLDNISKSECLAYRVESLHITDEEHIYGQDYQWHRHPSGRLTESLPGAKLLQDILSNRLVNCRSFRIDRYNEIYVPKRTDFLVPGDIVGIVIAIVAKASIAMRSFVIQTDRSSRRPGESRLDTNRLRMPLSAQGGFNVASAHLRELLRNYSITEDQYDWALGLISNAPRLRNLSLMLHRKQHLHTNSFMQRLISVQAFAALELFQLDSAHINVKTICEFLRRTRATLRVLSFRLVTVADGSTWATVLKTLAANLPHLENFTLMFCWEIQFERPCLVLFNGLTKIPVMPGSEKKSSNNQDLEADQRFSEALGRPIDLQYLSWKGKRSVVAVRYLGPAMASFLRILAEAAELRPPMQRHCGRAKAVHLFLKMCDEPCLRFGDSNGGLGSTLHDYDLVGSRRTNNAQR